MRPWALVSGASRGSRAVALSSPIAGTWALATCATRLQLETEAIEKRGASYLLLPFNLAKLRSHHADGARGSDCVPPKGLVHAAGLGVLARFRSAAKLLGSPWKTHFRACRSGSRGQARFCRGRERGRPHEPRSARVTPGYGPWLYKGRSGVVRYLA
jgi:hypothetical protein